MARVADRPKTCKVFLTEISFSVSWTDVNELIVNSGTA